MVKKSLLIMLLMALLVPWAAKAQTVTIGTETSTQNSAPIANYYNYSMAEMIFTADEIGSLDVNTLLSVGFECTTNVSKNYGVTIYMKNIEAAAFTATSDYITLTADDVVFTGTVSPTSGWTVIELPSPFTYDITGNLLIAVNKTSGGYASNAAIWRYTSTSSTYKMLYSQNDGSAYDPTTALTPSLSYNRPNVQLVFATPATCAKPTMNEAQNVDAESVSLSWTENGNATDWVLQYSTDEDFTNAVTRNRSGIPALAINDLTPLTTYYARVKADCGGGDQSQWSNVISFTTTAVAQNVGDGWADDFEGTSCGWELVNGSLTNKWCWGEAAANGGTHALYVSNDNGATTNYSGSNTKIFATKLLKFTEGKYEFSYDWLCKGESSWDFLRVALIPASITLTAGTDYSTITQPNLPENWIALDGGKLNLQETWQHESVSINVTAGTYYMVLAWRNDASAYPPAAVVDNVSITKFACEYDVTNLSVSDITTNSATLSWEGGEATQWQVVYGTASTFEGATEEIVDEASYDMTSLQGNTTYHVRVRAYCGGEDFGSWTELPSFNTACDAFDLSTTDFNENFDDMTASSNYTPTERTMPDCWNVINTCSYSSYMYYPTVTSYNSESLSGNNYLRFYSYYSSWSDYDPQDQYAILPIMENLDGKQIKLSVKGFNTTSTFYVGLMTNPTDPSTFVAFATQAPTTSYVAYEFPISGTGNYIAIKMDAATSTENSHGLYIDDIIVEDAPTCLKPTNLAVTATTTTTATLSWTNGASTQNTWQICLNGDEANLINANSNPFTIQEGLTPGTLNTAKVRAYCNADDQSDWSEAINFTTECETFTIDETHTYSQGFEGYTAANYGATDGIMPACWDSYSTGDVAPHIIGSGTGSYVYLHEGSNALTFYGSGYCYAALPEFTNAINELEIKFWMQTESASNGSLVLGYITAEDENYSTFTEIETYERHNNSMVQRTTDLNEVPSTASRLVFRWYYSSQYSCCIDDVEVTLIPTCLAPSALEVTATTTTTATFSWTNGDRETAWQICLNGDETAPIMADSNPFTVEGLTASTAYTAKVRAYCNADDQSDWSNEVSFTTACDVIVVDAAHPFTEGFESATFPPNCWESIPYVSGTTTRRWTRSTTTYIHTGSGSAYSGYYGPIYLVMPDLQLGTDGDGAQLSFWSNNSYVSDYNKNSVVLLDGDNEVELWSPESVLIGWVETTIDLTAYMGQTISLAFKYEGDNSHGWYVDDVQVAMIKTYTLTINGYENLDNEGGYYLIASPVTVDLTSHDLTTGDIDLYAFDQSEDDEWRNYKQTPFNLEPGKGYLYANKTGGDFTLTGVPYSGDGVIQLVYDNEAHGFKGWNLVGNPWGVKAYPNHAFYAMNENGSGIDVTPNLAGTEVNPMTGIFVVAEGEGQTVTFETENTGSKSANLALNITKNTRLVDRAIVRFGEGRQLPKIQLNPNHTKVFIPQDGNDYAIINATEMGEMPVSFKAENNGTYTLSFSNENVEFSYLHLIDNMTGNDVDLLSNPSYSFEAKTTDYASRFRLVFSTGSFSDDNFAFYTSGTIVINNDGNATLKVYDVTGRMVNSQSINGSCQVNLNATPGVYMIQLVNGDNTKTQKIVVK